MKNAYTNIAPRGQMQQAQPQPPYAQMGYQQPPAYPPNGYAGQPYPAAGYYPQQPVQPVAPQPVYPNTAYFVPNQVNIGEGSQEFRDAYQKNLNAFRNVEQKVKESLNESEAVKRVKEMSTYKTKVETGWNDAVQGAAINPLMMINYIENLCVSLQNPQEWLPSSRLSCVDSFREKSENLVISLKKWGKVIRQLGGLPEESETPVPPKG